MSSRVEVLEQQVRDLTSSVKSLDNKIEAQFIVKLDYNRLHHILEDVALVYKGMRIPKSQRPTLDAGREHDKHLATEYEGREKLRDK